MEKYIPRFLRLPLQNCFLFGPRGTGKSTFLRHNLPDALWIDLLLPENYRNYKAHPERLEELLFSTQAFSRHSALRVFWIAPKKSEAPH